MPALKAVVDDHKKNLLAGTPQLDMCDKAVEVMFLSYIADDADKSIFAISFLPEL